MITKDRVLQAMERAPVIKPVLVRLAKLVAEGKKLPETFSATGLSYAAQRELEGLFGTVGRRTADGRVYISVMPLLREPGEWCGLLSALGVVEKDNGNDDEDVFQRLKLLEPDTAEFIDRLAAKEEIARFVAKRENRRDWMKLFKCLVDRFSSEKCGIITTLSQLGSDWFNDSKKLRSGALRRQLVFILAVAESQDPDDESLVLEGANIVDNPYTRSVVFSAPVNITLKDGSVFDFADRLFIRRMAAQLPLETVLNIRSVEWNGDKNEVVTSENAAPFAQMVADNIPCVYTAGYPGLAVKVFLHKLGEAGVVCVHEGDADLDGFRIAKEVSNAIKVVRVVASEALAQSRPEDGIEMDADQRRRAWAFAANCPDFKYSDEVKSLSVRGYWIEQESFKSILGKGGRRK